jgi:hypothetical protein
MRRGGKRGRMTGPQKRARKPMPVVLMMTIM